MQHNTDEDKVIYELKSWIKIKYKTKKPWEEKPKKDIFNSLYAFFDEREKVLSGFKSKIFPIMTIEGTVRLSDLALFPKRLFESVPHPDLFWAYRFLEVKDWIV